MSFSLVTNTTSAVQLIMFFACILMGLSHILQPKMWVDYFRQMQTTGHSALITRTMTFELWPALILVSLHQVWAGPGIILTVYGWALLLKCTISLLFPQLGMRSLKQIERGKKGIIIAGFALIFIGLCAGWALVS